MKKVLVVYFTQSGQLKRAVDATLKNFYTDPEISVQFEQLKPKSAFPFPWSYMQFWDAFAETVKAIPCELEPAGIDVHASFDLVIIAYQPWFLSVSRPVESFLQSASAKALLKNTPVITMIACRNMWVNAQEKMKKRLAENDAELVGNIAYVDRSSNLTSLVTVLAFALGGVQDKFLGIFPKYGVSEEELNNKGWQYGDKIISCIKSGNYTNLQDDLIRSGAVTIKPNLLMMEGRGKILFPLYADFILKKGKASSRQRRARVRFFGIALPILILILSPLITLVSRIAPLLNKEKTRREIAYYSGVKLK